MAKSTTAQDKAIEALLNKSSKEKKEAKEKKQSMAEQLTSQVIKAKMENEDDELIDLMSSERLETATVDQLDKILDSLRRQDSYDRNFLDVRKSNNGKKLNKDEKIALIQELKTANDTSKTLVTRDFEYVELTLDQVCIHPDNLRSQLDYIDPLLKQSIRKNGNTSLKDIVISAHPIMCEDGVERYPAIAGNRNLYQHFEIAKEDNINLGDYSLTFKMITYGDPNSNLSQMQMLRDIVSDNNGSLSPSHLDRVKIGVKLLTKMTNENAAAEVGLAPNVFSVYKKYLSLPEQIQFHIDAHDKASYYERSLTLEQVKENGFVHDSGGGTIHIFGIQRSNADLICKVLDFKAETQENQQDILNWVLSDEFITNACKMTGAEFNRYVRKHDICVYMGIFGKKKDIADEDGKGGLVYQKLEEEEAKKDSKKSFKSPKEFMDNMNSKSKPEEDVPKYLSKFKKDHGVSFDEFVEQFCDGNFKPSEKNYQATFEMLARESDYDHRIVEMFSMLLTCCAIVPVK